MNIEYVNELLSKIADELSISDNEFQAIEASYNGVSKWLTDPSSKLFPYHPDIFVQGSMKLGTVIRPLIGDDYDVDFICRFDTDQLRNPQIVKELVRDRLVQNDRYRLLLDKEGKRCWTLNYPDALHYHVDILPAIVDIGDSLNATEKRIDGHYAWFSTNSIGFAKWFLGKANRYNRMLFEQRKIEALPEYPSKTPLQKAVQLLKRHRDVYFSQNNDDSPASVIITCLTALSYTDETNLLAFINSSLLTWVAAIRFGENGTDQLLNPALDSENLLDRWAGHPNKEKSFFLWFNQLIKDFDSLSVANSRDELLETLYKMFSRSTVDRALGSVGMRPFYQVAKISEPLHLISSGFAPFKYSYTPIAKLFLRAEVDEGYGFAPVDSDITSPLNKGAAIRFSVSADRTVNDYKVVWQVTNSGKEALTNHDIRGTFFSDGNVNQLTHEEGAKYSGTHFVQCFFVSLNDCQCLAMSNLFIVNIKG
jgi:hypothetical protein